MKNVIQNVVGVVVVAVSTYAGAIYGIEHSMYRSTPPVAVVAPVKVTPSCQEVYTTNMEMQTCVGGVEAIPQELVELACAAPKKFQGDVEVKFNNVVVYCYNRK